MWKFIVSLWNKGLNLFREFISEALPISKQIVLGEIKAYAIKSVRRLSELDLSNESKRSEAFQDIKKYAHASGINITDSLINVVLELAVQTLKR